MHPPEAVVPSPLTVPIISVRQALNGIGLEQVPPDASTALLLELTRQLPTSPHTYSLLLGLGRTYYRRGQRQAANDMLRAAYQLARRFAGTNERADGMAKAALVMAAHSVADGSPAAASAIMKDLEPCIKWLSPERKQDVHEMKALLQTQNR